MNRDFRALTIALALTGVAVLPIDRARAQTAAPDGTPPAVAAPVQAPAHQDGASKAAKPKSSAQEEAGEPRATTSAPPGKSRAADRVDLDTTTVTGNRELPKVMYVVPWKKSDIGDLGGKPMNSLLDEVLAPVDRDVFRREVIYYQAVKADAPPGTGGGDPTPSKPGEPPKQGEK
jgi:hypothetical protein